MDIICGKTPAYIPTSANELLSSMNMLNNSMRESIPPKLRMRFKHESCYMIYRVRLKVWVDPDTYDVPILKESCYYYYFIE